MIKTFADQKTAELFNRFEVKGLPSDIQRAALRKLIHLHKARTLQDLMLPASNYFETLKGPQDLHNIRINNQWRIFFHWQESQVLDVAIVDYY